MWSVKWRSDEKGHKVQQFHDKKVHSKLNTNLNPNSGQIGVELRLELGSSFLTLKHPIGCRRLQAWDHLARRVRNSEVIHHWKNDKNSPMTPTFIRDGSVGTSHNSCQVDIDCRRFQVMASSAHTLPSIWVKHQQLNAEYNNLTWLYCIPIPTEEFLL